MLILEEEVNMSTIKGVKAKKVVVIGGGFAGLQAVQGLKDSPVEITLIDKTNHHLFQPLLYQVATGALSPSDIAIPLREILGAQQNLIIMMSEVISIDKNLSTVSLSNGTIIDYDYLVIAIGNKPYYFSNPEWEEFAPGLKSLEDALSIKNRILQAFEIAENASDISASEAYLKFIIVGGGPTGVELAGAIAEIATKTLSRHFKYIDPKKTQILLINSSDRILEGFPQHLSAKAQEELSSLGVSIRNNTFVTNINADGVFISDEFIPCKNVFWAAGNATPPLFSKLEATRDKSGRILVEKDLSIPGHPNIFVAGDAAYIQDEEGNPLPGIAPVAMQQGKYVSKIIKYNISPVNRNPFVYLNKGSMATIGKGRAVASIGNMHMTGFLAWLAWSFIHILFLIGFKNKALVGFQWLWSFVTNKRTNCLITSKNKKKYHFIYLHDD